MKKFILGFITGGIICAAVTGFAVEYAVTANPYPVLVDGQEVDIEGYNINDSTYFKLRDIGDKTGFSVDFADNTIIINSAASTPEPVSTPTPTIKPDLSPLPDVETEIVDGVEYVRKSAIEEMLDSIGLGNYEFAGSYFYNKNNRLDPPLLTDIPLHPEHNTLIPYSYYASTIIPIINNLR